MITLWIIHWNTVIHWSPHTESWSWGRLLLILPAPAPALSVWEQLDKRLIISDYHSAGNSNGTTSPCLVKPRSTMQSANNKFAKFGAVETLPGLARRQELSKITSWKQSCEVNIIPRMSYLTLLRTWIQRGKCDCIIQRYLRKNGLNDHRARRNSLLKLCWSLTRLTWKKKMLLGASILEWLKNKNRTFLPQWREDDLA